MNKAREIYNLILIEINGYSKGDAEKLDNEEVEIDPIYQEIINILNKDGELIK